jgi:hypothetical protein
MDFVQALRPEHLQSFWYSASKYCFSLIGTFISLLWVTALEKEEADSYKAKLDEYRWTLRLSSKSADFLERAITMLGTSTGVLVKAIPDRPNVEFILNRNNNRAAASILQVPPEDSSRNQSTMYEQSESETHEDPSPDYTSPSPSNTTGGDWTAENAWFVGGSDLNSLNTFADSANLPTPFMQMQDLSSLTNGLDFRGFSGHNQSGDRES